MEKIEMQIPPNYAFIPGVRICIARIAYNFGFDDRESYQIETVVDEICNNAIEYGSFEKEKKIRLECRFANDEMELMIKDGGGREFNVEEIFQRNLKSLQDEITSGFCADIKRGRGLIIVQKLVDRLDIQTEKDGTTVKIIKKVQPRRG